MHVEPEIDWTAVDFDQANALLGHVTAERPAVSGLQRTHQAGEGREAQQGVASVFPIPGVVTASRDIGKAVDPIAKAAAVWLVINEGVPIQHLLNLLGRRAHDRLGNVADDTGVFLQQAVDIGFIEEAPIEKGIFRRTNRSRS